MQGAGERHVFHQRDRMLAGDLLILCASASTPLDADRRLHAALILQGDGVVVGLVITTAALAQRRSCACASVLPHLLQLAADLRSPSVCLNSSFNSCSTSFAARTIAVGEQVIARDDPIMATTRPSA